MALRLWNEELVGGRVPTVHPFRSIINLYSNFRNSNPGNHIQADFVEWLVDQHLYAQNTANNYWYPFRANQLGISALTDEQVHLLAQEPQGRYARIFLYTWYRCSVNHNLPRCLADVYIVGYFRGQGHDGHVLQHNIVECGYAQIGNSVNNLIFVGKGIGQHFGFLDQQNLPTAFFNSYFQESF